MGTEQVGDGIVREHDAPGIVRAEVDPDVVAHGEHRAVAPRADLDVVNLVARMGRRHHVLAPVLGPLHRPPHRHRGRRDQEVFRIAVGLGPEAAAHVGRDDPDLVGGQPEGGHEPRLDEVDDLRAVPRGEALVALIPLRDDAPRLHRHADIALDVKTLAHPHVGFGEGARGISEARAEMDADVAGDLRVDERRSELHSRDDVGDDAERLVVDLDQLGGVLGERAALRQHHGHDLADVAGHVAAERELRRLLHRHVDARGEPRRDGAEERQRLHEAREVGEREDAGAEAAPPRRCGWR